MAVQVNISPHLYSCTFHLADCLGLIRTYGSGLVHLALAPLRERMQSERLQQPYIEDEDDVIGQYLFDNKFIEDTKRTLHTFWKVREKRMKEKEDSERDSQ